MKSILKSISIIGGLLISLSCEDTLVEDPVSLATADGYYTTASGIEDALKATYTPMRRFYGRQEGFFLTVTGTDIFTNGFGGVANAPDINNYSPNLLGTNGMIETIWDQFYTGINQANTVVERAPEVENMEDTEKARVMGEARFLRALYYFHLVQQFGPVHFTLEETKGVQTEANRTPVATVYDQGVVPDLEYAIANLPVATNDYGRVTKPAAEALLARVHLTLGNWTAAETLAAKVIDEYNFQLVTRFADLWDIENDVNDEIIWSIQYTGDPLTNDGGNWGHLFFIFDYTFNPAMTRNLSYGRPWQRFLPTNYLLNLYDRSADARWDGSFRTVWFADIAAEINGTTVNPGDTAIKIVMYEVPDEIQESSPYWLFDYKDNWIGAVTDDWEIGTNQRRNYPSLLKYMDPLRSSVNATDGRRDFPVIRLAEMYLIASEAAWQQGKSDAAAEYMNVIRTRAALPGQEAAMQVAAADIDLDFILGERARELVGEMHRWYDLKRTGTLLERVREYNLDAAPNIQEMHLVRPIPQTQIDRVSNPGEFTQNSGY